MTTYDKKFIDQCADTWIAIGTCADTIGQVEKAVEAFSTALRYTPNNAKALTHLAHVYRTRDAYAEAADLYRRALALDQHNGETWGLLGHCYLMLDDLQSAYTAYQQALLNLQNLSVPKLWHGIGILYDRYGSLEYAEEAFVRVLEMDPNFDKANEVYFRLGIIYKLQGKLQKALECFQYILNRPPAPLTQTDVWFQIGTVLEQNRDFQGSKEAYERVLQASPNHSKVLQQLGGLYSQPEAPFYDLDIALQLLNQSIELNNSDAHSWYYIGRVYMSKQDYPNAYESFQHAVNLDSRNPTFWCSIGVLYYKISQYKDALDAYTRAIRLNPYLSEVWYDLGTLYETCNNQIGDALDAYRRAASLDPDNPHIAERLMQLSKYEKDGGALPPPVQTQHQLTMPSHQMIQQQQQQQQQQHQQQQQLANGLPLGQQFQLGAPGNPPSSLVAQQQQQQQNEQLAQVEAQRHAEAQRLAEQQQRLESEKQAKQRAEEAKSSELESLKNAESAAAAAAQAAQVAEEARIAKEKSDEKIKALELKQQKEEKEAQEAQEKAQKEAEFKKHEEVSTKTAKESEVATPIENEKKENGKEYKEYNHEANGVEKEPTETSTTKDEPQQANVPVSPKGEKRSLDDTELAVNGGEEKKQKVSTQGPTISPSPSIDGKVENDVELKQSVKSNTSGSNGHVNGAPDIVEAPKKTIDLKPMEVDDVAELKGIAKDKEDEVEKKDLVDSTNGTAAIQSENTVREVDEDENYDD